MEAVLKKLQEMEESFVQKLGEGEKTIVDSQGRIKSLEEELTDAKEMIKTLEKSIAERKWMDVPGVNEGKEKFSLFKTVRAVRNKDWSDAGYEKEVVDEARKKALATSTADSGGVLVPTQAIQDMIELLRATTVLTELGTNVLDGLTGVPVEIPQQTGGATTYWVGENQAITASDLTFGQLALSPHSLGALVKLSNRLVEMSLPSAEQVVRNDISQQMALRMDLAGLRGTGVNGQPLGLSNVPGLPTVDFSTAASTSGYVTNPGYEQFYDMEYQLAQANALRGNVGFAFHPTIRRALAKIRTDGGGGTGTGDFVTSPAMTNEMLRNNLGYPFQMTTQIPIDLGNGSQTEIYMGNWSDLIMAMWGGMRILASQETSDAFEKNQTWVRILMDVDFGVRHVESFVLGTSVNNNIATVA